ncbi:L,D-transpeptidase family protein [Nitrospirillum sp. BR 11828]|uniref:L,D-transpeptidase family protein n=1 Tax=Nitrospirillum sp. BR 11828 TaxID=3104325 RepID=UPI002ACAD523|nr:L,D-transpeptidase family protein [Nitrospirillum sp. BR 11828]MDZ5647084.1 L,D-transpeptidase family protein [Nitrospirillum sp. BR 11828]
MWGRAATTATLLATVLIFAPLGTAQARDLADLMKDRFPVTQGAATADDSDQIVLARFYRARGLKPLWVDHGEATATARAALTVLAHADEEGLNPNDYSAAALTGQQGHLDSPEAQASFESGLSLALVHYASDVSVGRIIPTLADPELVIDRPPFDRAQFLAAVAAAPDLAPLLAGLPPHRPEYAALKAALAHYRQMKAAGGWPTIPPAPKAPPAPPPAAADPANPAAPAPKVEKASDALKPGMVDPRVPALRARLVATGEAKPLPNPLPKGTNPELYDDALAASVKEFQRRQGQEPDGAIGKRTLVELNATVDQRINQIIVNMERWRWEREPADQPYLVVNLADYTLSLMRGMDVQMTMRVVVGAPFTRTPVFIGNMSYMELNPYWYVPTKIAKEEILPKQKKDHSYVVKNHYTLLSDWTSNAVPVDPSSINWATVTERNFHWRVRQDAGNDNSLGRIKFMFPNKFDIYLHDTPSKRLFDRAVRSFSHGCIRVQDPPALALAILALTDTPGWPEEKLRAEIGGDSLKHQTIRLKNRLPVHITYITTVTDPDGGIDFRTDVYGRDARVLAALNGPRPRKPVVPAATPAAAPTPGSAPNAAPNATSNTLPAPAAEASKAPETPKPSVPGPRTAAPSAPTATPVPASAPVPANTNPVR